MANVTLRFKGLNCFGETDELSGSDEIYLFTIVTTIENGKSVVRTEKHPVDRAFYDDVDKGASFGGPIAPCYFGAPQDMSLSVIMMEQDEGDPNAFKGKIDAAVKAAAAAAQGVPIPEIAQQLVVSAVNELLGSGDDNIGEATVSFTRAQVLEEAHKPRGQDQNVSFTFFTEHNGEGSTYRAFFDFVEEGVEPGKVPTPRIAFNPEDRFVVVMGKRILVTVKDGRVFAHDINGNTVNRAIRLTGPPVAFNPEDRFVVVMGNRILVTVKGGGVFAHDINGNTIGPAIRLTGPPVAFNPEDRFVVVMGNRILVTVKGGGVFAHDINGNTISPANRLTGPPVAFNPEDRFVVVMGNRILVTVKGGGVFAHDINGNTISPAIRLAGPPVAFNPQDHFVVVMGNRILIIVNDGRAFAHDINGNTIGAGFQL